MKDYRTDNVNWYKAILIANIAVFIGAVVLQIITNEFKSFDLDFFTMLGGLSTKYVTDGKIWLLITSNFLHLDPLHFFFNIYAYYNLGKFVQNFYGNQKLLITYVIGGLVASLATLVWAVLMDDNINSVGASGAVFALLGLLVGGAYHRDGSGQTKLPLDVRSFYPTLVVAFLVSLLPQVNLWAHVGGFVTGFLLAYLLDSEISRFWKMEDRKFVNLMYNLSILIFAVSFVCLIGNFLYLIFIAE